MKRSQRKTVTPPATNRRYRVSKTFGHIQFSLVFVLALSSTRPASAAPPIWQTEFGGTIAPLAQGDDVEGLVTLSFPFPFGELSFTELFVGTNGGLQLGSLGEDGLIDYDVWEQFHEFIDDGAPVIFPFVTDLSLESMGAVHANDFGDHVVFTWNDVGSYVNLSASFTFQAQLYDDGRIVFGYNGLPTDLISDLDSGIVIGISPSDNPSDPGAVDFATGSPFATGDTAYEIWCYDDVATCDNVDGNQLNDAFDLDHANVVFTPTPSGGFYVTVATETSIPWLPGDINLNGQVDRTDIVGFLTHFGSAAGGGWTTGDFDQDGNTNLVDLARLRRNFGLSLSPSPDVVAVPEPSTLALLLGGGVCLAATVRRRAFR